MKNFSILNQFAMVGQFGLALIMPLLICVVGCYYICAHFSVGGWIYIVGFFFGLGGSATVGWKVYKAVLKDDKKKEKRSGVSFNRHE